MNTHHQAHAPVQPAVPLPNGRPGHMPYTPPPFQHHPPPYPGFPYQYPGHHLRPQQQWPPYAIPMPPNRGYQQYQQMQPINPYPMPPGYQPMRASPQPAPSSSSVHSARGTFSPSSSNTSLPVPAPVPVLPSSPDRASTPPPPPAPVISFHRIPFYPPLPQSFGGDFPARKSRRRRQPVPQKSTESIQSPESIGSFPEKNKSFPAGSGLELKAPAPTKEAAIAPINLETPLTSQPPSEAFSTQPTTPSPTTVYSQSTLQQNTPKANNQGRIVAMNKISIIPAIPNFLPASRPSKLPSASAASEATNVAGPSNGNQIAEAVEAAKKADIFNDAAAAMILSSENETALLPAKVAPKSWADLVKSNAPPMSNGSIQADGIGAHTNGIAPKQISSLADALNSFSITDGQEGSKLSFLEPRGLVNTGNMCYMNSILQILVFCAPFYTFLEKVGRQAAHNFKSDTPMMDAMIMFMREFRVIDAAISVDKLRLRLKNSELEQYGEAFIPEYVYGVIRRLPRFSSMRRGHQQDAEEFLGFLLEEMHDECSKSMQSSPNKLSSGASTPTKGITSPRSESTDSFAGDVDGWLEVGPKQRVAVTRSSGAIATESPITKIFGGKLRSELRVPGVKNSVTLEPYQPLQLDIGAPNVVNIVDALKGLTKPETLHGHFNSPRGPGTTATKQVSIETLPQVLILHLKRFQYDNAGGTQKIWKKVGYPLDLEIPKEVFPQHKRGGLMAHSGLPKYRLIGVVYHHGKNASGGHYTVDVRRQEGREWIRLDDTVIKRIRNEDVAEGGCEEDPKVLAAALEHHKHNSTSANNGNVFEQFGDEDEEISISERPWSQVNGSGPAVNKKRAGVTNGIITPVNSSGKATPRSSVKDNKVAYILFYQKVGS